MATKKTNTAPVNEPAEAEVDEWDSAREVLIVSGTAVREPLGEGESFVGIYLGRVVRKSTFGKVNLHLFQADDGMTGFWGHHTMDEGCSRLEKGVKTRIDGKGFVELDSGKRMRLVRMRQLGAYVDTVTPISDPDQQAREVFEALGIDPEKLVTMDDEGEVIERVFADLA